MVNYGIVYGLSAFGLADRLQIEKEEAQEFIDAYLERFPKVREFIEKTMSAPARRARGHALRQDPARARAALSPVPDPVAGRAAGREHGHPGHRRRHHEARHGAGARRAARGRLSTTLVLQIHDELLFEAPDDEVEAASEIIVREMATAFEMDPPLEVDCGAGRNWLEAK
jgi:DNA polymerase-1